CFPTELGMAKVQPRDHRESPPDHGRPLRGRKRSRVVAHRHAACEVPHRWTVASRHPHPLGLGLGWRRLAAGRSALARPPPHLSPSARRHPPRTGTPRRRRTYLYRSLYSLRMTFLSILPTEVAGISSTTWNCSGNCHFAK